MEAAEIQPEIPAMIALASLLEISILVLQALQFVAEKLLSNTNFLKEIGLPQPGQQAFWFLDIGLWIKDYGYRICRNKFLWLRYKELVAIHLYKTPILCSNITEISSLNLPAMKGKVEWEEEKGNRKQGTGKQVTGNYSISPPA